MANIRKFNLEIYKIFQEDQKDRQNESSWQNPLFLQKVVKRDAKRRNKIDTILKILKRKEYLSGEDFFRMAIIFQHGLTFSDSKKAISLAKKGIVLRNENSKWIYAAATDRLLIRKNRKQKYGTQYHINPNGEWELYPINNRTTDKERKKYNVPALKRTLLNLKKRNQKMKSFMVKTKQVDAVHWNALTKLHKSKSVIFLGELHGAQVNITLIKLFIEKIKPRAIVFEWPTSWNKLIHNYMQGVQVNAALKEFKKIRDGKISKDHLKLLRFLHSKKINVLCVDSPVQSWNIRDKKIAQNIQTILGKKVNTPCLIILGNLHARKARFLLQNKNFIPAGSYFKNQAFFILASYGSGSIYNFTLTHFTDKEIVKRLSGQHDYFLTPSLDKYFDYEILIRKTKPVRML